MKDDMTDSPRVRALAAVHYLFSLLLAVYYVSSYTVSFCRRKPSKGHKSRKRPYLALGLLATVIVSYVLEAALYLARALIQHGWWADQHCVIYVMASIMVFGVIALVLLDAKDPVWYPYLGTWLLAIIEEIVLCVLSTVSVQPWTQFEDMRLAVQIFRIVLLALLFAASVNRARPQNKSEVAVDGERRPLLNGDAPAPAERATDYGTGTSSETASAKDEAEDEGDEEDREVRKQQRKRIEEQGGWWGYLKGFAIFLPYIFPLKYRGAQLCMAILGLCIIAERFLNVLTPRQLGIITNKLAEIDGPGQAPWKEIGLWIFYQLLSSPIGIGGISGIVSVILTRYSYRAITTVAFSHVMRLSMSFHHDKDSGEIYQAIEDAYSLNSLMDTLFETTPVIIDFVVAFAYVSYLFDVYVAFTIVVVFVLYIWAGLKLTAWYTPKRRKFTEKRREHFTAQCEAIGSWETVSYFNRNQYEEGRVKTYVNAHMDSMVTLFLSMDLVSAVQSLIMTLGLLTASFLAVYRISRGDKPVGSFITLITYWGSIMAPVQTLLRSYRQVSSNLIDAERLLQVLKTEPTVTDKPGASSLVLKNGKVEFQEVSFHYDPRKTILKGVSFVVDGGQTVALVGETGCGKSTILKLLFRFYDVTAGGIKIDGQDISDVTLSSLRESLGVVPQDPSLFNKSIMDNVRYARLEATDEEVQEACKAAAIHDKIMSFPDGYASKVGERGVKLSGGELQRVAIARVILRNPRIVLLDEATSAIDSTTEAQIQKAFHKLSSGRTTIVIAHRLSTIRDADLILVIKDGEVVERGSHEELIRKDGKYTELWSKQASRQAEEGDVDAEAPLVDITEENN